MITIKEYTPKDTIPDNELKVIIKLLNKLNYEEYLLSGFKFDDWTFKEIKEYYKLWKVYTYLAISNDKIIGVMICRDIQMKTMNIPYVEVGYLYIEKVFRGLHISSLFFDKAFKLIKQLGYKLSILNVIIENINATRVYEHKGYIKSHIGMEWEKPFGYSNFSEAMRDDTYIPDSRYKVLFYDAILDTLKLYPYFKPKNNAEYIDSFIKLRHKLKDKKSVYSLNNAFAIDLVASKFHGKAFISLLAKHKKDISNEEILQRIFHRLSKQYNGFFYRVPADEMEQWKVCNGKPLSWEMYKIF